MSYVVGQTAYVEGRFGDSRNAGAPVDPLNLKLHVERDGIYVDTFEYPADIVRIALGHYYCLVPLTDPGQWRYRWQGDNMATPDRLMNVNKSAVLELVP